jgi:hypothetical protein
MKKVYLLGFISAAALILDCATARVIKQTDTTAVIQGVGPTEFEAKENASKEAEKILGSVKETQKAECNQEVRSSGSTSGTGANQQYSASSSTYYSCVMYFAKQ